MEIYTNSPLVQKERIDCISFDRVCKCFPWEGWADDCSCSTNDKDFPCHTPTKSF